MAITDKDTSMTGISSNPSLIIKAVDYIAPGAEVVYDSDYLDGKAVRGTQAGQKIFETEWLKAGVLTGNVLL